MNSSSNDPYQHFSRLFLAIVGTAMLAGISFNMLVDPWEVFNAPRFVHFNTHKAEVNTQQRLYKALKISEKKPSAIILGSSRTMIGLNPEDFTPFIDEEIYNSGLSGATFDEIYAYFEHALYNQPELKHVFIGLDFMAFNKKAKLQKSFSFDRIKTSFLNLKDFFLITINKNAFISSYKTIKESFSKEPMNVFDANGYYNLELVKKENNAILIKGQTEYLKSIFLSEEGYKNFEFCSKKVDLFKCLVETCKERGIQLYIFFCPTKAVYWQAIYQSGSWNQMEQLKRELCRIYPIWDFSGFNAITAHKLEDDNDPFYFECSHFTSLTGRHILAHFFGQPSLSFGYLLTPQTVESILKKINIERIKWSDAHKDVIRHLEKEVFSQTLAPAPLS